MSERFPTKWLFMPMILVSVFAAVLANSMVNVVMPVMADEFGVSVAEVAWVLTGFSLVFALGIPLYGKVADAFSIRDVFVFGLAVFAVGSFVCAAAPGFAVLVIGRIVQAVGAAAMISLAFVVVAQILPSGSRGGSLGLLASSAAIGAASGPVIGGYVQEVFGWRVLFLGLLAVALALIPVALLTLPHGSRDGERNLDLTGGLLLGMSVGLLLLGVTMGQTAGFSSVLSWGSFAASGVSALVFGWHIRRTSHPFVSPSLFENRTYTAAVAVGFFSNFAYLSSLVFVPQVVTEVNGLSAGMAGLVLAPGALALAILSPLAGRISDRAGARLPAMIGLAVMGGALLFISTFAAGSSALMVSAGMLGVGTGMAFVQPPVTNAASNSLPSEEVGAGIGIFQGAFFLGSAAGPALIGALLAARKESGGGAINPLYSQGAAQFSDAFLVIAVAIVFALAAALMLKSHKKGG